MSLDSAVRALAQRAVHAMGQAITLRRVTVGTYATATGAVATTTEDTDLVGRVDEYLDRQIGGTIHAGDRKLLIAAADVTWAPTPKDKVIIADIEHAVVSVKQDIAAAQVAMYTLQIRPFGA